MTRSAWRRIFAAHHVLVAIIGFLAAWEIASYLFHPPQYLLPLPTQILAEIARKPALYFGNGWQTLYNTLWAFGLSTVIGVAMAVGIVYSKLLEKSLYALLVAFNSVPKVALAPIFVLWLGTGDTSKIAIAFFIAIFAIVVDAVLGLRSVDPEMLDLARALRGSELKILVKIRFPNALPAIFSGMKVAVALSLVGVIVGEFVAAKRGLGYVILVSQGTFDTTAMFAAIFVLAFLGTILFYGLEFIERLVLPWHVSHRSQRVPGSH
ncbi:MAG: ABC transporter permease [Alphaproteobacteria bacterium]|nr:ABC transporter permease [Alphaproteobacteria bacterium]